MSKRKRFYVISPDGFPDDPRGYPTRPAAEAAMVAFIQRYRRQGYYASVQGRIPLVVLHEYMTIEER